MRPGGRLAVRLDNGHLVDARMGEIAAPALGQAVIVQMAPDDLKGWRLARRP